MDITHPCPIIYTEHCKDTDHACKTYFYSEYKLVTFAHTYLEWKSFLFDNFKNMRSMIDSQIILYTTKI